MISVVQRVLSASVDVVTGDVTETVAAIDHGLLVLAAVQPGDGERQAEALAERLLKFRVFDDGDGRMNLNVRDVSGSLLLVSQFTLAADTRKGHRPGFSTAAAPEVAEPLFEHFVAAVKRQHPSVCMGRFGAHMRVALVNDGPVTFRLEVPPEKG